MREKLKSILLIVTQFIQEQYLKSHNKWVQRQQEQKDRLLSACLTEMIEQMVIDLYEALKTHNYYLAPLLTSQSIRFYKLMNRCGYYQYQFTLDKTTCEKIPAFLLDEMRGKMNTDIATATKMFMKVYGNDYVNYTYPFLAHGIYITAIQDLKMSSVIITVETHLTPEIFHKIYRQSVF